MDKAAIKQKVCEAIAAHRADIEAISEAILAEPELGFKEVKTSRKVQEALERLGIEFTAGHGITGVKARMKGRNSKRTVAMLAELDAIVCRNHRNADPVTGAAHCCGHNIQIANMIAVACGLLFAGIIQPGMGLDLSTEGLQAKEVVAPPLVKTLLAIVPINPMQAMAEGSMLQIIFFAVIFGFALSGLGERGKPVLHFFEIVGDVMIRVTHMVMLYAPIGVFGLISFTVSRHGLAVLLPLGALILTAFLATVVFVGMILLPLVRIATGIPIMTFLKGIFEPWLVAFTTCSSAAALPANLNAARKLGSTKAISSFSIPLGNTINMNGTAIYMGVCSIFAAAVYGLPLTMADQLTIVLMGVLAAVGTAGVPGAGLIMTTIIFTQVGIPLEAVALIAGVDRILDMIRTSINVVGDVAAAVIVTKMEGDLNSEPYVEGAD